MNRHTLKSAKVRWYKNRFRWDGSHRECVSWDNELSASSCFILTEIKAKASADHAGQILILEISFIVKQDEMSPLQSPGDIFKRTEIQECARAHAHQMCLYCKSRDLRFVKCKSYLVLSKRGDEVAKLKSDFSFKVEEIKGKSQEIPGQNDSSRSQRASVIKQDWRGWRWISRRARCEGCLWTELRERWMNKCRSLRKPREPIVILVCGNVRNLRWRKQKRLEKLEIYSRITPQESNLSILTKP